MFIELTDHLRCPAPHDESFLVLLPDRVEGRVAVDGHLGCPVCGRIVPVRNRVASFGPPSDPGPRTRLTADAVEAFLGLSGPGGYVALVGAPAALAPAMEPLLAGVRLVAVNPPDPDAPLPASILLADRLPLKGGSMRGVVVGAGLDAPWLGDAVAAVLPGLRVVAEGAPPALPGLEVLAQGGGAWVGRRA